MLARIRREASGEAEKRRWFEHLFMATVRANAELDVTDVWRWRECPERERLTGLDGRSHDTHPKLAEIAFVDHAKDRLK